MKNTYTVIDEFDIKNSKIIVLDRRKDVSDLCTSHILVDGNRVAVDCTHNETWFIVNERMSFKGKSVEFVN
ncbi:MAG: hypothetical protein IJD78_05700 [Clostridia bacterium]|nr:hypothetical protein [Clostridia bacterium]